MARRRFPDGKGGVDWKPYAEGVYKSVPLCLLRDRESKPICLLFAASCHPSTFPGYAVSADYPGVAMAELDDYLDNECSLFLQGVGGDSKVISFADPERFGSTWDDVQKAGEMLAADVIAGLEKDLCPANPSLACAETEVFLPLAEPPTRSELEAAAAKNENFAKAMWARNLLARLDRGEVLPTSVPVSVHGVQLAAGVRLAGLEVEPVAEWGRIIEQFYGSGVTFALGYTDGCQLYLPTTGMLAEGGYEVSSFWEYHWPAQLTPGIEDRVIRALSHLKSIGVR